jgi:hypothetical protein
MVAEEREAFREIRNEFPTMLRNWTAIAQPIKRHPFSVSVFYKLRFTL